MKPTKTLLITVVVVGIIGAGISLFRFLDMNYPILLEIMGYTVVALIGFGLLWLLIHSALNDSGYD